MRTILIAKGTLQPKYINKSNKITQPKKSNRKRCVNRLRDATYYIHPHTRRTPHQRYDYYKVLFPIRLRNVFATWRLRALRHVLYMCRVAGCVFGICIAYTLFIHHTKAHIYIFFNLIGRVTHFSLNECSYQTCYDQLRVSLSHSAHDDGICVTRRRGGSPPTILLNIYIQTIRE